MKFEIKSIAMLEYSPKQDSEYAENRIIRIGDGAVFLIILQIRCVAPSIANTAIERKSGANPVYVNLWYQSSVDSAMLSAVARIIATTHGRTPDKKALTGAYFIRFFSADAIKRIIKNDGNTTPSVATNEPRIPPCVEPIKVAIFTARGPGVDSDTAIKFRNSFSVSQPLKAPFRVPAKPFHSRRRKTRHRSSKSSERDADIS